MEPSSDDEDEEMAAALEARRATVEHLLPQEAAVMLGRMSSAQAAQLVLLMGSSKRDAVIAEMAPELKSALADHLPPEAADALGLCEHPRGAEQSASSGCNEAHVQHLAFQPPQRDGPTTSEEQQQCSSGLQSCIGDPIQSDQPDGAACAVTTSEGTGAAAIVDLGHRATDIHQDEELLPQEAAEEVEQESSAKRGEEEAELVADKSDEVSHEADSVMEKSVEEEIGDRREQDKDEPCPKNTDELETQYDTGELQNEGGHHQEQEQSDKTQFTLGEEAEAVGSAGGAKEKGQEEPVQVDEDIADSDAACSEPVLVEPAGIVETWMIGGKPAVREQRIIQVPVRRQPLPSTGARVSVGDDCDIAARSSTEPTFKISQNSPAEAAMQLGPLPNDAVADYLECLGAPERHAILCCFPLHRREELASLLSERTAPASSSSTSPAHAAPGASASRGAADDASDGKSKDSLMFRAKSAASRTADWGSQVLPPKVSHLAGRASGVAGAAADLAKQGFHQASEMAPGVNEKARQSFSQAADKAASAMPVERAKGAASSAAGLARQGMSQAAHSAGVAKNVAGEAAGAAKQSVNQIMSSSSLSSARPAVEASSRLAKEMTGEAKQKAAYAAGAAKVGLTQVSQNVSRLWGRR